MEADNVYPIDSAPNRRADQAHAEAAFNEVVAGIAEQLHCQQWAKIPASSDTERACAHTAARAAGNQLDTTVVVAITPDGAVMATIDEESPPVGSQPE